MSNELVQIDNSANVALVNNQEMNDGLNDSVKLKPGQLKLVQPTTTSDVGEAKAGQIFDSLTQRVLNEIILVPLRVSTARAFFPKDSGLKSPTCKSDDGIVPAPYVEFKQASTCGACKNSKWGPRINGKATKPQCGEQFRMLVLDKETTMPYYITFKGTGFGAAKDYLELVKATQGMLRNQGKAYNLRDFYFTLTLDGPRPSTLGKFWVPKFSNPKYGSEPGKYEEAFNIYARYSQQAQEDEEVEAELAATTALAEKSFIIDTTVEA